MTVDSKLKIAKFGFNFLLIIAVLTLFTDTFLSFYNISICPTEACKIAGNYLIFKPYILTLLGGLFFLLLFLNFWLYKKKKGYYESIFWLLIFSALSFDGVLVGYLYKTKTFCLLCLGVASFILLSLIFISYILKNYRNIIVGVLIWLSSLSAVNILHLDKNVVLKPKLEDSVMIYIPAKQNTRFHADLFVSLHCIHCLDVLYNLAMKKEFENTEWKIHFVGGSEQDYMRVAYMLNDPKIKEDPFNVIVKYILQKKVDTIKYDKQIETKFKNANYYFSYMGFRGIPLLKMKFDIYDIMVLGDKDIGKFLMEKNIVDRWYLLK